MSFSEIGLRRKLQLVNTPKRSYEAPALKEIGSVAELTQAQNVVGPGDNLYSVLKAAS